VSSHPTRAQTGPVGKPQRINDLGALLDEQSALVEQSIKSLVRTVEGVQRPRSGWAGFVVAVAGYPASAGLLPGRCEDPIPVLSDPQFRRVLLWDDDLLPPRRVWSGLMVPPSPLGEGNRATQRQGQRVDRGR
jgi:hypothetical protein